MPQTAKVSANLSFIKTTSPDGGAGRVEQALSIIKDLVNGTGNGQADLAFIDTGRQLADGASEDLDLAGSLTDAFGNTITAAEIVAVLIENPVANTTNLTIGGATAEWLGFFAAAGDKLILKPGDFVLVYSHTGWAVGAGATDDLRIANAAGAINNFNIGFLGRSA
jgi:hypothetical protein